MTRGYNELVGLQVTFSRTIPRYRMIHIYRWVKNEKTECTGTMRGFDIHRHLSVASIIEDVSNAYASVTQSIWRQMTDGCLTLLWQFDVKATPMELKLDGLWEHWCEK